MKSVVHKIHNPASLSLLSSNSESEAVVVSCSLSLSIVKRLLKYSLKFELSSIFAKVSAAFFFLLECSFLAHKEVAEPSHCFAFHLIPMFGNYDKPFGGGFLH